MPGPLAPFILPVLARRLILGVIVGIGGALSAALALARNASERQENEREHREKGDAHEPR